MQAEMTARQWFEGGERTPYDYREKRILQPRTRGESETVVDVFRRVRSNDSTPAGAWTTLLPGFPDGSFGWSRVDRLLEPAPRLFVEYVGQGDSDKPSDYPYGTMERADLVEAQWRALGIASTFVVTFDYSSIVALELLSRQQERLDRGLEPVARIERVLLINGGLFADAHSHPWVTTPLLKTRMGRVGTWWAQRSRIVFDQMLKGLFSKEYGVTTDELGELYEAIGRRDGAAFMSNAAGFVDEHRAHAERWDLQRVFDDLRGSVSFHIVGTAGDPFERNQIVKAKERLGRHGLDIRVLPGGHMATSEQSEPLARIIDELRSTAGGRDALAAPTDDRGRTAAEEPQARSGRSFRPAALPAHRW